MLYRDYKNHRRQYQEHGAALLLEKKHACLFYSPGKGKTYPVIDALMELNKDGKLKVLIISSADAIRKMWQPEIVPQKILPDNTYLVTAQTAIGDIQSELLRIKWDVIIVDECHIIKSHNAQISKLVYRLTKEVEYAWGLTGTPRGNRDLDIWCQFHNLNIANCGKMSYHAFTKVSCLFETVYGAYGVIQNPVAFKPSYQPIWDAMLTEYAMFVDYDETDDMPDLNVLIKEVDYEHTDDYKRALKGILEVGDFSTTTNKLIAIRKAQQVCNGYMYLPDKTIWRFQDNGKLQWLRDNTNGSDKAVIIYWYQADLEDLQKLYAGRATTDVNVFKRGGHQILLLQEGCGRSFNLQDHASRIIFYTYAYSFIDYKQVIHRCWRLGQKQATEIIVLQHRNTIEKQIWHTVTQKQNAHDMFMSIKLSI